MAPISGSPESGAEEQSPHAGSLRLMTWSATLLTILTSIIEIFFKRCANGCDAPLSSNRHVALRKAAEPVIQTLPLEARTTANGRLLSNRNGEEFIRRCFLFQRPPKSAASSVKENAWKLRAPGSVQPKLRLSTKKRRKYKKACWLPTGITSPQ
jgi:hypothetical protein